MIEMIRKHLDDLAAGNWNEYRAALTSNATYEEVPTRQIVHGVDEYIGVLKRWKTAFPDMRANVRDIVMAGDRAFVEVEWEGTHRGALQAPFGNIPATNKQARVGAVLVMKIESGKIRSSRHYFDLFTLMTQLGVSPSPSMMSSTGGGTAHAQPSKRG